MIRTILLLMTLMTSAPLLAENLDGFWQHEKQPLWIEVSTAGGGAKVVRNDNKPDAVGFEMLRNLERQGGEGDGWTGEVYAAQLGEFKSAKISLLGADLMQFKVKVGFMSRTVEWQRVKSVPES